MAASLANIVKVTGSAVTTVTTAGVTTQASGSTFVVSVAESNAQTVNTPTDIKSNTYTQVGTKQTSTGGTPSGLSVYAKENGTGGATHTATVTFGASSNPTVFFCEVAGCATASIDTASRAQGSDAATPYTITSGTLSQADNLVLCFFAPDGAGSGTASYAESTGFTISGQETNGASFWLQAVGSKSVLATTALTPSWTEAVVTTSAGLHVIAFKSAATLPVITAQPTDQIVNDGATANFSVTATGATSYQWKKNGSNVGTDSSSYSLTAAYADQGAQITVDCINGTGTTTSSAATLRVAFELSGTGPRSVSLLGGGPMGAGSFESYLRSIDGGGGGPTTITASPGAWSWAGSTSTFPVPQVSITPGAWTWAGSTQAITQLISVTPGVWSWAGTTQATTQLINQTTGTWSWAGSTQALTQLLNAAPGTWTWTGSTQTTTQLINAAVGAWTWAGSTQTITAGLVEVNAAPGTWVWVGSTATFPAGATTIDTTPGTWSWVGSTAEIPTQISAITGTWAWNGSNATTTQLLNVAPGSFTWAGSTATTSQVFDATPGLWSWAGSVQGIVSQVTIDASPGNWTWAGSQASVISFETGNIPAGGSGGDDDASIIRYRRAVFRRQQEASIAAKAKAEADEAQQRLNTANTKRQREKEARIIEKLRRQEEAARTLEEQLMVEIELLQRAILGANTAAQQTAMQAEEEEFALMFALTTLI